MTKYEDLISEYENRLLIEEHKMKNHGLYADGVIWLKDNLPESQKYCVLAEEIGHHETSSGDILDLSEQNNAKQEAKARRWAYEKILPSQAIISAMENGCTQVWEIAEYLDIDERFLRQALKYYGLYRW